MTQKHRPFTFLFMLLVWCVSLPFVGRAQAPIPVNVPALVNLTHGGSDLAAFDLGIHCPSGQQMDMQCYAGELEKYEGQLATNEELLASQLSIIYQQGLLEETNCSGEPVCIANAQAATDAAVQAAKDGKAALDQQAFQHFLRAVAQCCEEAGALPTPPAPAPVAFDLAVHCPAGSMLNMTCYATNLTNYQGVLAEINAEFAAKTAEVYARMVKQLAACGEDPACVKVIEAQTTEAIDTLLTEKKALVQSTWQDFLKVAAGCCEELGSADAMFDLGVHCPPGSSLDMQCYSDKLAAYEQRLSEIHNQHDSQIAMIEQWKVLMFDWCNHDAACMDWVVEQAQNDTAFADALEAALVQQAFQQFLSSAASCCQEN